MSTIDEFLTELPEDRRAAIQTLRQTILANLPEGLEEGVQGNMIGYFVPHSRYPKGYHCNPKQPLTLASIASQKNYIALHLMFIYGDEKRKAEFCDAYKASGKKLDMGQACVRFKRIEDLPLEVVADAFASLTVDGFLARYEAALEANKARRK